MYYKEINNFLTLENKEFINKVVLSDIFPFYLSKVDNSVKDEMLTHVVLRRPEERQNENEGFNSDYAQATINILENALKKAKLKPYKKLLRICYNFTFNNSSEKCPIHNDHQYNHKQFLMYLNNPIDKEATTVILKDKKIYKNTCPEQYKAVIFDNLEHYFYYPKEGSRIVLVITFL
jgi:hypothetical protein